MTRSYTRPAQSNWTIFRWAVLVAILSIAGLLSALMGDGAYDAVSWLVLGALALFMWRSYCA